MIFTKLLSRRRKKKTAPPLSKLETLREDISFQSRDSLEKELFKFAISYNVTKEVSGNYSLEKTLNILVDRIAQVMRVEIVSLMLVGKNSGEMLIKFAKGLDKEIVRNVKVKLGEGVSGWVAQTGEALLIKDIASDSRFPRRNGKYNTNSLLSVPLKIQDRVIGVINVNNKISKDIFNEEDLDTLKRLADLVALAVANSRLREDAKELDELRSSFIANVSHELRTPLTALKESVAIILDEITGNVNDSQKRLLNLAVQNINRLTRLIDDLLDFSKTESATRQMRRVLFNIVKITEIAVATLEPLAKKKEIEIKTNFPRKKVDVWGDEDKLYEVVSNFIDNAIKYNKPKGKIEIKIEDAEREVRLHFSDTGIGIAEENIANIFNRFNRINGPASDKIKGTGLGLSIVKDIIEMHGGSAFVNSKLNQGSTFTVTLPKNLRIRR